MRRAPWWQTGVIYQIYPRSFQDGNGDGIGDLRGIMQRLPYLVELGIDAIWMSPIFQSPMADFGYDISDYTGIDPLFGSLRDFDAFVQAAHQHSLKVILDLVPTIPPTSTPGSGKVGPRDEMRNGTGTSGGIRRTMADRPTIGCPSSAATPGHMIAQADSITITPFCPSSRISIGATRPSGLPSTR
jgi:hypothetical protein